MYECTNKQGTQTMATAVKEQQNPQAATTVGDCVAAFLAAQNVDAAFGVISIHNMPILDAIGRLGKFPFVPSRGEAGAVNMADACARVSSKLSAAFTSTGTGAGNAAGALIEALTAGSPVLHLTGQIESDYLDRDLGYIHEAPAQLDMLKSVSKTAYRVSHPAETLEVLERAATEALTAPMGPVSVEIPIDVQKATLPESCDCRRAVPTTVIASDDDVGAVLSALRAADRPVLMFGGGARNCAEVATRLANRGIGVVTSTNGRAIVPEDHPMSLGAFNLTKPVQSLYESIDLLVVVGSRLRSNETWTYNLDLPKNLIRIDCDVAANGRSYPNSRFVHSDALDFLTKLDEQLAEPLHVDAALKDDIAAAKQQSVANLRDDLGPYAALVDVLSDAMPPDAVWVRDVTLSNSMWGNRMLELSAPNKGVHALGGGIGQGLPMAVGASCAADGSKTILLTGDGGLSLCLGELVSAAEQNVDVTMILMNDNGYGVIRNIQDDIYGGRKYYSDIYTPKFAQIAEGLGVPHSLSTSVEAFRSALEASLKIDGFSIVEVDMVTIGPFARNFAGPPRKT